MRNTKDSHLITVRGIQYRWRAKGTDDCITVAIWPATCVGPYMGGSFDYHNTWVDNGDGSRTAAGDQIVVTSKLVERIIEHAINQLRYDPNIKGKQLNMGALERLIRWDDAVRATDPGC